MEGSNIYQVPSKFHNEAKQRSFWIKVICDQIASGIGAEKFCKQHQINLSKFSYWKYSKIRPDGVCGHTTNKMNNPQDDKDQTKFISLQIATDKTPIDCPKADDRSSEVLEIIFKNGNKVILPAMLLETNLLLLVQAVGGL
jgi:hypothetical protein